MNVFISIFLYQNILMNEYIQFSYKRQDQGY